MALQKGKGCVALAHSCNCPYPRLPGMRLADALVITVDKGGGICVRPHARVRLSVCLCARLLKNACMDLDEMRRVDRCRDMDELINF